VEAEEKGAIVQTGAKKPLQTEATTDGRTIGYVHRPSQDVEEILAEEDDWEQR